MVAGIASLYMMAGQTNYEYAEELVKSIQATSAKFSLITDSPLVSDIEIRIDLTGCDRKAGDSWSHMGVFTPHMQMSNENLNLKM